MSQQFRVSPWITYDPAPDAGSEAIVRSNVYFSSMDDDVDMDAPQISTLPEDGSPEPQPSPARTSKFRVKLLVNDGQRSASQASTSSRKPTAADSDEEEDEDEEDQLIDDDDEDVQKPPVAPVPVPVIPSTAVLPTRGSGRGSGRGTRGTGRGRGRGSRGGKRGGMPVEATDTLNRTLFTEPWGVSTVASGISNGAATPMSVSAGPITEKKKPGPAKGTQRAIRKKVTKPAKVVAPPLLQRDDAESVASEGFPPTAVSSPMPPGEHSPEPDIPVGPMLPPPVFEDSTLEGVPVPQYPLPTKPFPVQPPPKIGTGFAPAMPLDKSHKPVRRWRQVNREVRGIAGGRWFTRTWLGDKESDYASAIAASNASAMQAAQAQAAAQREAMQAASLSAAGLLSLPKLPPLAPSGTISAPIITSGRGRGRGRADPFITTIPLQRSGSATSENVSASIPRKRKATAAVPPPESVQAGPAKSIVL